MNNHSEIVSFIWGVANLIRDTFKRGKYQDVILPLTVLRRLDCVLAPTKETVLEVNAKYKGKLENLGPQLSKASGYAFYNTSRYDFESMLADAPNIANNLRNYILGFSDNMREVIEKFDFDNTITKLEDAGLLFRVLERFKTIDLHPDKISNHDMGYIFEELIRKFNEALNENPGEHFTPREVIRLMVGMLLSPDGEELKRKNVVKTVYDPCCGSGGMLTIAKDRIAEYNPTADIYLYGQESQPETFAICKSDLYMKSPDGRDAENILFGNTLSNDRHAGTRFDYLLANPPYGKDWNAIKDEVDTEAERGYNGRFGAGLPRKSDGQLLFLQHMLGRMKTLDNGGSRVAIIMNGSPLFTGDAGSGESEIRRWVLENDWLEAIIAMPEQLFYNTGIATYVWVLSNRKQPSRCGKVQMIDASDYWVPMRKSLGDKRREISEDHIGQIVAMFESFTEGKHCKIFNTTAFGYRKITVERPLRLNFQASAERIERLYDQRAFAGLAVSQKKKTDLKAAEEEAGRKEQIKIIKMLRKLPGELFRERELFEAELDKTLETAEVKIKAPLRKAILSALSKRDEDAEVCRDKNGSTEADSELRDYENVPLGESVEAYYNREVAPHVPDAWINQAIVDHKDGKVGRVGYEINFNRYFYQYIPPRPLDEIEADIKKVETEIMEMIKEIVE